MGKRVDPMMKTLTLVFLGTLTLLCCTAAQASYVLEIDIDGLDDGVLTFSPNFSFGGDTTSASQSAPSPAVGMTGGDSIFGGNGTTLPDTYVYRYTPGTDGDNRALAGGTPLNNDGNVASGVAAGASGDYAIYATWPFTANVTGGPTRYELSDGMGPLFSVDLDQNNAGDPGAPPGAGGEWVYLGTATLDAAATYTLTQSVTVSNTFVSMRGAGILFDVVPEPASTVTLLGGLVCLSILRRQRCRR